MANETVLEGQGLGMSFELPGGGRLQVLKELEIRIGASEIVAITGRSGAGKSTLLHILGGLQAPSEGRVEFQGQDLYTISQPRRARVRNRSFGFVFQAHHLLPGFTALENVLLPVRIAGGSHDDAAERAAVLLDRFGLSGRSGHLPTELSGGECQRVALARALINAPSLLFADEPTGNLDLANADQVLGSLTAVVRESGGSVLIVTHDSRVTGVADRVIELG